MHRDLIYVFLGILVIQKNYAQEHTEAKSDLGLKSSCVLPWEGRVLLYHFYSFTLLIKIWQSSCPPFKKNLGLKSSAIVV